MSLLWASAVRMISKVLLPRVAKSTNWENPASMVNFDSDLLM